MADRLRDRDERTGAAVDAAGAAVPTGAALVGGAQVDTAAPAAPSDASAPKRIQWHPAFCCAMELELAGEPTSITFERELNLTSKPLQVDLLVIVNEGGPLEDPVARAFRRYNVIEYKSPRDGMDIDDFYKLLAYGCLYKIQRGKGANKVQADEVTLTLVREKRPRGMLKALAREGTTAVEESPGVYRLEGGLRFATQLVVTGELPEDGHAWLRALTRDMTPAQAASLVAAACAFPEGTAERRYADAVLHVALNANRKAYKRMKEDAAVVDVLDEYFREMSEAKEIRYIKNLMKSFGVSASQAMDGMGITDPATRERYARLVTQGAGREAEQAEPAKEAAAR